MINYQVLSNLYKQTNYQFWWEIGEIFAEIFIFRITKILCQVNAIWPKLKDSSVASYGLFCQTVSVHTKLFYSPDIIYECSMRQSYFIIRGLPT